MNPILAAPMDSVLPMLFIGLMVGATGLALWGARVQQRKTHDNLRILADRLGVPFIPPAKVSIFSTSRPSVQGSFRGRGLHLYTYTTGSGKNRTTWCAVSVQAATPAGFSLKISGENIFTKTGRIFGLEDVATGDAAFDGKFYIRSKQASYIRAALIPEVRLRLAEAWSQHGARGSFSVESGEVKYAETGTFANARICGRIPPLVEIACDLAEIAEAWRE